jgi:hypothetical protein
MDRRLPYRYVVAGLLAALTVLAAGGCQSLLVTLAYMTNGGDSPAEFPGLKDKKVVVVCRPVASLQYRNAGVARELAQQIGGLLQTNLRKIKVIDQQKVAAWEDENTWNEYREIGSALGAEMVVGVDLTAFSTYEGPTLYRGRANAAIKVYDLSKENSSKLVWEKTLPQAVYPPSVGIPTSDQPEAEFRREFVAVLADQIGRHFYAHDPHADIVQDAKAGLK